jgi:hypothetical protein
MKRPFGIKILALVIFFVAIGNGLRLGEAIYFWKILAQYHANAPYIAISGGIWLLLALVLAIAILLGKAWAWAMSIVGAIGYGSWYWIDRLFVQLPHANWLFMLVFSALLTGLLSLILFNDKTRLYFKRSLRKIE